MEEGEVFSALEHTHTLILSLSLPLSLSCLLLSPLLAMKIESLGNSGNCEEENKDNLQTQEPEIISISNSVSILVIFFLAFSIKNYILV